jgi:hypothetical protein
MLPGCFSLWSPKFVYCYVVLPGHLSQHAKAATAEGLTFSDPIHKKSARNLNLYNFCHSPTKLAVVSPFTDESCCKNIFAVALSNTAKKKKKKIKIELTYIS